MLVRSPAIALGLLLLGCMSAEAGPPAGPVRKAPGDCELELLTFTEQHPDGHWELVARAKSWASAPIEMSIPVACPMGPARFEGLPGSYDYYGACAMGPCPPGQNERRTLRIAPRELIELARTRVDPRGNSCNKPLPPGRYTVRFTIDLRGATTCEASSGRIDIPAPGRKAPRKPSSPRSPPAPQVKCPPMPTCGIGCDGPPLVDKNGCPRCGCADQTFVK